MRGSIIERNGSYRIAVSLGKDPVTQKYKRYFETVRRNKKDAQRRLRELLSSLDNGTFSKSSKLTVASYLEQWLRDYCQPNLAPHTTESYEFFIRRHIIPDIGLTPLCQLKPADLQHLYASKLSSGRRDGTGGLGSRSVKYIHTTLHRALNSACKMGLIVRNPADAVDVPKITQREMRTMDETDVHLLLEFAKNTPYYALFYLALFSGMRRSELLGFRWCDLDLLLCQASISRTLHRLHTGETIIRPCKTPKSKRLVSLSPSTVIVLREHKEAEAKQRGSLSLPFTDDDYVFAHYDGSPLLPDSVTQAWRKLARRIGLKGIRLHDCRHTHASLLLKQNVHPAIVAQRLGHASVQITLDVYSHILPGLQRAAANRFDDILMQKQRESVLKDL